jgi:hypothetical protein
VRMEIVFLRLGGAGAFKPRNQRGKERALALGLFSTPSESPGLKPKKVRRCIRGLKPAASPKSAVKGIDIDFQRFEVSK